jgi:transaldolase
MTALAARSPMPTRDGRSQPRSTAPIVAAVDDSSASGQAVDAAVRLAKELKAGLTFVYVRRGPPGLLGTPVFERRLAAKMERARRVLDRALRSAVEEDAVVGVTSNPTIFQKALARGHAYDEQIAASVDRDPERLFLSLALDDVAAACDLLRPVWERAEARDGYVSIEVEPTLANDTQATIAQATHFHDAIARPNLLVKIPATDAGVPAIEEMTAGGYSINVTLIFSLRRHRQIAEAYLRGLERLVAAGGDPSRVHSVASFFVSRVDTETDRRLTAAGRDDLKGRLAIANAKLAYQQYKELFSGERWESLASRGATAQRCLWASTSTKDPSLRDTLYVEELIGPETISTMPAETIEAFQDHGRVELKLEGDLEEAQYLFNQLHAAGVDYEDVVATLEREGIDKFLASFTELLQGITEERQRLAATV